MVAMVLVMILVWKARPELTSILFLLSTQQLSDSLRTMSSWLICGNASLGQEASTCPKQMKKKKTKERIVLTCPALALTRASREKMANWSDEVRRSTVESGCGLVFMKDFLATSSFGFALLRLLAS
ncbi:hypothetical protein CBR_g10835 [Chara braunii]|uniref:Secreted protein n=1 Tax=Chara braunii TaxID=69332 RepID=A0A388KPB5_CHABU|nr:hypothetical protein CBR_g10835 [Chara braunii]|eukprot:GBG71899.1 hypothetical protein CBR_g10835 [Chara braunii]